MYPESNIVAVDYDPGASEVNQLNRIKLMISVAKANLEEKEQQARLLREAAHFTKAVDGSACGCGCGCADYSESVGQLEVEETRAQ